MYRVHLDTVHSGVLAELGGLGEGLYHLVNLFCGEGAGYAAVLPAVGCGAGAGGKVAYVQYGLHHCGEGLVVHGLYHYVVYCQGAAKACGELYEHLAAGLVEFLHEVLQLVELALALIKPLA